MLIQTAEKVTVAFDDTLTGSPVVVLLHAFPLSREMWKPQREALKSMARVITPDLRGFGGTELFHERASVEVMATTVAAFLDAINIREPIVLGGLSMGGYVALAFARLFPERLKALILADTKAEPDDDAGKANRDATIAFAKEHTADDVIARMMPKMVSESTQNQRPEVVNEVKRIASAQSIPGIVGALQALRDRPDSGPGLARVAVPCLVIVGEDDALTPPSVAQQLAQRIAGSQQVIIPGAGHLANLEQPAAFNDAIRTFLAGLPN